tara:strand:- start:218 stop:418 length:201 start_codon:yes stop_codon:yes gene_type:complete
MQLSDRLLRLPEVLEIVPIKKSTLYDLMRRGLFPKNIKLGSNIVAWKISDIDKWIANKIKESYAIN